MSQGLCEDDDVPGRDVYFLNIIPIPLVQRKAFGQGEIGLVAAGHDGQSPVSRPLVGQDEFHHRQTAKNAAELVQVGL